MKEKEIKDIKHSLIITALKVEKLVNQNPNITAINIRLVKDKWMHPNISLSESNPPKEIKVNLSNSKPLTTKI